jgi:hypothetical protein
VTVPEIKLQEFPAASFPAATLSTTAVSGRNHRSRHRFGGTADEQRHHREQSRRINQTAGKSFGVPADQGSLPFPKQKSSEYQRRFAKKAALKPKPPRNPLKYRLPIENTHLIFS